MKNILALIIALVIVAAASQTFAQSANSRIVTTVTTQQHDASNSLGRDFWFAPAQNYIDEEGKYIRIYITSPNNTVAFVDLGGVVKAIPVPSYGVGTFDVPLAWEMKSSGIVENKAIHVYDKTDDIAVSLMSHEPYSSDGMRCIPTIGWGTDYVVAAYGSLYEGPDAFEYDLPSEFTISADQDNTEVDITPSCDMRNATGYSQNDIFTAYPKGEKQTFILNRGQSLQLQSIVPGNDTDFDVTGTIIHSNVSVGVVGASMSANIPMDFGYSDYITDMIPPVRTWGKTYYTTNPVQPQGAPSNHDNSMYCIISSVPNQTIYRYDPTTGLHQEAILGPTYDHLFIEEELANRWSSDDPFLLIQYINSASYPDEVNGNGDPAECVITPAENFTKDVILEEPKILGVQEPYDNYAIIIVDVNAMDNSTFDGKKLTEYTQQPIDGKYTVFLIPHIASAAHRVHSDSAVGAYEYGYGFDESYMWGSGFGNNTFNSPDTVPPKVIIRDDECFGESIHITDSGALPGSTTLMQSGLNEIRLDSDFNMAYMPDQYPNWIEGNAGQGPGQFNTSNIAMYVVDPTKPAVLIVSIFDAAGNRTTITSTYTPQIASIGPLAQNFGVVTTGDPGIYKYDTITNLGRVPFKFTQLNLLYGNRGFSIDSSATLPFSIPVGGNSLVKLRFYPVQLTSSVDSLIFGDPCITQEVALIGSGGAPDFYVTDVVWKDVPLHPTIPGPPNSPNGWVLHEAIIHNLSKIGPIHVSSTGWADKVHFALVDATAGAPFPQTFPITLGPIGSTTAPYDTAGVWFWFSPTDLNPDTTIAMWTAPEVLDAGGTESPRQNKLIGNAVTPSLSFTGDTTITINCADPAPDTIRLSFVLSNSGTQASIVSRVILTNPTQFINLIGRDQHLGEWDPANTPEIISANDSDMILVDFPVSANGNSSGTTHIIALDDNGDTIGGRALTATVNVNFWGAVVSPTSIPFGPVAYKSGPVSGTFTITNTASSRLAIDEIDFMEGAKYNSSYSFSSLPALPDTLQPGNDVNVTVLFNPSISRDILQNTEIVVLSNACNPLLIDLSAALQPSSGVAEKNAPLSSASVIALEDGQSIRVTIPSDWTPPTHLEMFNILGESIFSTSLAGTSSFDLGAIPRGVYFYRLRDKFMSQTGKIVIGE